MHGAAELLVVPRAEKLGDDNGGTGAESGEEAYDQIRDHGGGAADRRQGVRADKAADDDRVDRVVELEEQQTQEDGEEKARELSHDAALGQIVPVFHAPSPSFLRRSCESAGIIQQKEGKSKGGPGICMSAANSIM